MRAFARSCLFFSICIVAKPNNSMRPIPKSIAPTEIPTIALVDKPPLDVEAATVPVVIMQLGTGTNNVVSVAELELYPTELEETFTQ